MKTYYCLLLAIFITIATKIHVSDQVYFFLEPGQKRCFVENMPKHTVFLGNYSTLVESNGYNNFVYDPNSKIQITVESGYEIIMNQSGPPTGRFFFISTESTEHLICFSGKMNNWLSSQRIKMNFSVFTGEPGETTITSPVEAKLNGLARKVQSLNSLVADIRRDLVNHRKREADFRDKSEQVNQSVVWGIIIQLIVLSAVCLWQLKHLENFFRSKKLV